MNYYTATLLASLCVCTISGMANLTTERTPTNVDAIIGLKIVTPFYSAGRVQKNDASLDASLPCSVYSVRGHSMTDTNPCIQSQFKTVRSLLTFLGCINRIFLKSKRPFIMQIFAPQSTLDLIGKHIQLPADPRIATHEFGPATGIESFSSDDDNTRKQTPLDTVYRGHEIIELESLDEIAGYIDARHEEYQKRTITNLTYAW